MRAYVGILLQRMPPHAPLCSSRLLLRLRSLLGLFSLRQPLGLCRLLQPMGGGEGAGAANDGAARREGTKRQHRVRKGRGAMGRRGDGEHTAYEMTGCWAREWLGARRRAALV